MSAVATDIARRAAARLRAGESVNLGIGIPTLVADHVDADRHVVLQTENGMLGVGPTPDPDHVDPTLVNAGKLPITELPGASYFSSSQSFAMIRGGHVDVAILGALEVDERGRIANWSVPGRPILGVGGAMDLLVGASRILVTTTHLTKTGAPKLMQRCSYPLTGERAADVVLTDRATFEVDADGLLLTALHGETTLAWLREHTAAAFRVADALAGDAPGVRGAA